MCGIAGIFGAPENQVVENMLGCIVHRGPDDGYCVVGNNFSLGARRLSIVDLSGGRQPLSNSNSQIWAAQNGEIYNFSEIKDSLLALGHEFSSRCDTEVIPHLYEEYGLDFVKHMDGMFAVSLWDSVKQRGVLARDRMGKKPLFYCQIGEKLYFASEIKCLLSIPGFERRINFQSLDSFLALKHVPGPATIFEGIYSLPPAHLLEFAPGSTPKIQRYWDLSFEQNLDISEDEASDKIIELLERGVKKRFMSDVPLGFFLSGGLDSSLSTVIAARLSSKPIKTFTLAYDQSSTHAGKQLDQTWARWLAKEYKTEHFEEVVNFGNYPETIKEIIKCFDEPFAGTTSGYFLAGLIAKHVRVAISGDGADELFGSYFSHRQAALLDRIRSGDDSNLGLNQSALEELKKLSEKPDWQWRSELVVFNNRQELYSDTLKNEQFDEYWPDKFANLTASDTLNRVLEAEFKTIFPDQVLTFVDRLSMAHSLEVRTAYMDTALVEFVASLPGRFKIKDGENKYILKKAAAKLLPLEMINRPKEGFVMPVVNWFRSELAGYVRETLSPARLRKHNLFDQAKVNELIEILESSNSDYHDANRILCLVVFQEWYELYMESIGDLPAGKSTVETRYLTC